MFDGIREGISQAYESAVNKVSEAVDAVKEEAAEIASSISEVSVFSDNSAASPENAGAPADYQDIVYPETNNELNAIQEEYLDIAETNPAPVNNEEKSITETIGDFVSETVDKITDAINPFTNVEASSIETNPAPVNNEEKSITETIGDFVSETVDKVGDAISTFSSVEASSIETNPAPVSNEEKSITETIGDFVSGTIDKIDNIVFSKAEAAEWKEDKRIKEEKQPDTKEEVKYVAVQSWNSTKDSNDCLERIVENSYDLNEMGIKYGSKEYYHLLDEIMKMNPEIFAENGLDSIIYDNDKIKLPEYKSKKEIKRYDSLKSSMLSELEMQGRELRAKKSAGGIWERGKAFFGYGTAEEDKELANKKKIFEDAVKSGDEKDIISAYQKINKDKPVYIDESGKVIAAEDLSEEQKTKLQATTIDKLSDKQISKFLHGEADKSIEAENLLKNISKGKLGSVSIEEINAGLEKQMNDRIKEMENTFKKQGDPSKLLGYINNSIGLGTTEDEVRAQIELEKTLLNELKSCKTPEEYAVKYKELTGNDFNANSLVRTLAYEHIESGKPVDTSTKLGKYVQEMIDESKGDKNALSLMKDDEILKEYKETNEMGKDCAIMGITLAAGILGGPIGLGVCALSPLAINAYDSLYDTDGDGIKEFNYTWQEGLRDVALGTFAAGTMGMGGILKPAAKLAGKLPVVGNIADKIGNSSIGKAAGKMIAPSAEDLAALESASLKKQLAAKTIDLSAKTLYTGAEGGAFGGIYGGLDYSITTALDDDAEFSMDELKEHVENSAEAGAIFNIAARGIASKISKNGRTVGDETNLNKEQNPELIENNGEVSPVKVNIKGIGEIEAVPKELENGNIEYVQQRETGNVIFETDKNGNLIKKTENNKNEKSKSVTAYDENGNPIKRVKINEKGELTIENDPDKIISEDSNINRQNAPVKIKINGLGEIEAVPKKIENGSIEYVQERETGNLSFEVDTNGNLVKENIYNKDGKLTDVKTFNKNQELINAKSLKYDENGKLVNEIVQDKNGNIISKKSIEYNENGNPIKETVTDNDGNILGSKSIEYDTNGNIIKEIQFDKNGGTRILEDYKNGIPTKETIEGVKDINGNILKKNITEYDENGNIKRTISESPAGDYREIHENDTTTIQKFNPEGKLENETITDKDGNIILQKSIEYDANGNPLKEIQTDKNGNQRILTDYQNGEPTKEIITDKDGNPIQAEITPEPTIEPTIEPAPEPTIEPEIKTDSDVPLGENGTVKVNIKGIGEIEASPKQLDNGNLEYVQQKENGNVIYETDKAGNTVKITINENGSKSVYENPDENGVFRQETKYYDDFHVINKFENGKLKSQETKYNDGAIKLEEINQETGEITSKYKDTDGYEKTEISDKNGNLIRRESYYPSDGTREIQTVENGKTITKTYNKKGKLQEIVESSIDQDGKNITKYYDKKGKLKESVEQYINQDGAKITNRYDKKGKLKESVEEYTHQNGNQTTKYYDGKGKLEAEVTSDKEGNIIDKKVNGLVNKFLEFLLPKYM